MVLMLTGRRRRNATGNSETDSDAASSDNGAGDYDDGCPRNEGEPHDDHEH